MRNLIQVAQLNVPVAQVGVKGPETSENGPEHGNARWAERAGCAPPTGHVPTGFLLPASGAT
ncbi:hypothetical protein GCM10027074_12780 [Streptomyces deserti]